MPKTEVKTTEEIVEPKTETRKDWVCSGITIMKGSKDYKFYIEGVSGEYVGALGGDNIDDKKAEQRAMKIAVKLGISG